MEDAIVENEKDMQKVFSENIEKAISEFCSEQNNDTNLKVLNAMVAGKFLYARWAEIMDVEDSLAFDVIDKT